MRRIIALLILFVVTSSLNSYASTVIDKDTLWTGDVTLAEDVLILPGVTLSIAPGTVVHVSPSESTKTDPQFISSYTEITVRGAIKAAGSAQKPIIFAMLDPDSVSQWAGIMVDGGTASLAWCQVSGAQSALTVIKGAALVKDSRITNNRYGASVLNAGARLDLSRVVFADNDYGLVLMNGAAVTKSEVTFLKNKQKDILATAAAKYAPQEVVYSVLDKAKNPPYQSESMLGTVVWKDRVTINGVIRIPPTSRLIIMPGTIVEFGKKDSNGDGIGENGLLVMGMLIAKGTKEKPIIFRSAEKNRKMGDWDAINIYTSDGFQNLLEYVQVEDAYRGLHIHFSNVLLNHAVLRGNYRGMQFQESTVVVKNSDIYANKSAMRARDSELSFINNRVYDNYSGPNIFRITGRVQGNIFANNYYDGLRVREGALDVEHNAMYGNRYGMTVAYANFGTFSGNVLMHNHESGLILKGTDNIKVAANFIQANAANGISLLKARAEITGNQISYNAERGIGIISFSGSIHGNNITDNALYGLGLDGDSDIDAANNFWGRGVDMAKIIYDHSDDPALGRVNLAPALDQTVPFNWPLPEVSTDTIWQGELHLVNTVDTRMGSSLIIKPGTVIKFAEGKSLWLYGKLEAVGTPDNRILITAMEESDKDTWDQITTEKNSAIFKYCDFRNGNMALHSHFSNVEVDNCTFKYNESGFRVRGGPVSVSKSFFSNNLYGMVFYLAKGVVEDNIFTDNEMGILVRAERRSGMVVRHNNIFANSRYNMRMGDFNQGNNVNARDNWWGEGDPADMIWDDNDEAGIGFVDFEPFAKTAFSLKF